MLNRTKMLFYLYISDLFSNIYFFFIVTDYLSPIDEYKLATVNEYNIEIQCYHQFCG